MKNIILITAVLFVCKLSAQESFSKMEKIFQYETEKDIEFKDFFGTIFTINYYLKGEFLYIKGYGEETKLEVSAIDFSKKTIYKSILEKEISTGRDVFKINFSTKPSPKVKEYFMLFESQEDCELAFEFLKDESEKKMIVTNLKTNFDVEKIFIEETKRDLIYKDDALGGEFICHYYLKEGFLIINFLNQETKVELTKLNFSYAIINESSNKKSVSTKQNVFNLKISTKAEPTSKDYFLLFETYDDCKIAHAYLKKKAGELEKPLNLTQLFITQFNQILSSAPGSFESLKGEPSKMSGLPCYKSKVQLEGSISTLIYDGEIVIDYGEFNSEINAMNAYNLLAEKISLSKFDCCTIPHFPFSKYDEKHKRGMAIFTINGLSGLENYSFSMTLNVLDNRIKIRSNISLRKKPGEEEDDDDW